MIKVVPDFLYDNGNVKTVRLNNAEKHSISYDNLGNLTQIKNVGGRTVKYTDSGMKIYNDSGTLVYTSVTTDDGTAIEENYGVKYKELEPSYDYDADTGVSTNTSGIEIDELYRIENKASTDWFGREDSHSTTIYNITEETEETPATVAGRIVTDYEYPVSDGKTSQTIEKYVNKTYNGDSETVRVFDGYFYEYDRQNSLTQGTVPCVRKNFFGIPDYANGRFATLGWAKNFTSVGYMYGKKTWKA